MKNTAAGMTILLYSDHKCRIKCRATRGVMPAMRPDWAYIHGKWRELWKLHDIQDTLCFMKNRWNNI